MGRLTWLGFLVVWSAVSAAIWAVERAQARFNLSNRVAILAGGLLVVFLASGVYAMVQR